MFWPRKRRQRAVVGEVELHVAIEVLVVLEEPVALAARRAVGPVAAVLGPAVGESPSTARTGLSDRPARSSPSAGAA